MLFKLCLKIHVTPYPVPGIKYPLSGGQVLLLAASKETDTNMFFLFHTLINSDWNRQTEFLQATFVNEKINELTYQQTDANHRSGSLPPMQKAMKYQSTC